MIHFRSFKRVNATELISNYLIEKSTGKKNFEVLKKNLKKKSNFRKKK